MNFKSILFSTVLSLSLLGCGSAPKSEEVVTEDKIVHMEAEGEKVKTATLGESCESLPCGMGLECNDQKMCIDSVVDKSVVCPETQKPVCGLKNGRKNGYLNDCEARRHGAEVVSQGLCKKDISVEKNCEATLRAIGTCKTLFTGYEKTLAGCTEKKVEGCEAEIPFLSKEECEAECGK